MKDKSNKKRNKANETQMAERIDIVGILLLKSESTRVILKFIREKWNVSESQANNYIRLAKKRIEKVIDDKNNIKYRVGLHISFRHKLLKQAMEDHETQQALSILDSLAKIEGLLDPALQDKLRAETELYKKLNSFPIETALKILNEK